MRKEKEGNDGDPEGAETTIYDPASRDWLARVGGTCVCLRFSLTMVMNRNDLIEKTKTKSVLHIKGVRWVLK